MYCACKRVCGHISACKHVASSEEQWCIHSHQSEPRANPALMAVIIKKAFREGRATKGGMVGVVLVWLEQQSDQGRTGSAKNNCLFWTEIPENAIKGENKLTLIGIPVYLHPAFMEQHYHSFEARFASRLHTKLCLVSFHLLQEISSS